MNRSKAREHAFQILFSTEFQMLSDKEDPLEKLDQVITDHLMTFQDQDEKMTLEEEKFIRREVTGTMTHLKELDEAISEYSRLTNPHARLASTNESMSAGPAYFAAATPGSTKMPVPTMMPTPMNTTSSGPRALLKWVFEASDIYSLMLLVRKISTRFTPNG